MYMLASYIITTYSGVSYPQFIQERIFDRLNMSSTTFSPNKAQEAGKLADAWTTSGRLIPFWFSDETLDLHSGPGGIISSVEDMVGVWFSYCGVQGLMDVRRNGSRPFSTKELTQ